MSGSSIEVIARAIITDESGEKMLFCSPKNEEYFYLPGGHVEFGETAVSALVRELYEETEADTSSAEFRFAGAHENIFTEDDEPHHEVNLYFEVSDVFSGEAEIVSAEDDLSFKWIPLENIVEFPVLPPELGPALSRWRIGGSVKWK